MSREYAKDYWETRVKSDEITEAEVSSSIENPVSITLDLIDLPVIMSALERQFINVKKGRFSDIRAYKIIEKEYNANL